MDRGVGMERVKGEREADVMYRVGRPVGPVALHHDIADIAPGADLGGVERRVLPGLPRNDQIAALDTLQALYQLEDFILFASSNFNPT